MTNQNPLITLDPRDEASSGPPRLASRPTTLDGKVIGLLSNNKPHSETLLRLMVEELRQRYNIKGVVEYNKGGHQWPATREALREFASKVDVAIHATAE